MRGSRGSESGNSDLSRVAANGAAPPGAEGTSVHAHLPEHPVGLFADRTRQRVLKQPTVIGH